MRRLIGKHTYKKHPHAMRKAANVPVKGTRRFWSRVDRKETEKQQREYVKQQRVARESRVEGQRMSEARARAVVLNAKHNQAKEARVAREKT